MSSNIETIPLEMINRILDFSGTGAREISQTSKALNNTIQVLARQELEILTKHFSVSSVSIDENLPTNSLELER